MRLMLVLIAATAVLSACHRGGTPAAAAPTPATQAGPSLYTRLGGVDAIRLVVDDFTARLAGDAMIAPMLRGVDVDNLRRLLAEQICEATGGPCRYSGRTMREAHRGLNITAAQWDATVGHLVAALNRYNVGQREQQELLGALATLRGEIVGR